MVCVIEELVPVREESVSLTYGLPDESRVLWTEQPRLSARGVQMSVSAEEGLIRSRLIPSDQQLGAGMLEESTHIGWERRGLCEKQQTNWITENILAVSHLHRTRCPLTPNSNTWGWRSSGDPTRLRYLRSIPHLSERERGIHHWTLHYKRVSVWSERVSYRNAETRRKMLWWEQTASQRLLNAESNRLLSLFAEHREKSFNIHH